MTFYGILRKKRKFFCEKPSLNSVSSYAKNMKNLKWQLKARNWLGERPIMKETAV